MNRQFTWILAVVATLLGLVVYVTSYSHQIWISRKADVVAGKGILKLGFQDYLDRGIVPTSRNPYYDIWLCTNIVTVDSVRYQCCVAGRFGKYFGHRTLSMTTNGVFLLVDSNGPTKLIKSDYSPRRFPPGF